MASSALQQSSVVTRPIASTQTSTQKSPVYEYSCLFTRDIRRKNTKRWQDGFLRFHIFNKRVMVYDQSRNYVGDTHFHDANSDGGLEDGEELKLERGGVLIQVGEKLSVQETDLSDLLAKRPLKATPAAEQNIGPKSPINLDSRPAAHLQPRSTNVPPVTPGRFTSLAARAQIPKHSPYERRQAAGAVSPGAIAEQGRAAKRQKIDDEHVPLRDVLKLRNSTQLASVMASAATTDNSTSRLRPNRTKSDRNTVTKEVSGVTKRKAPRPAETVNVVSSPRSVDQILSPDQEEERVLSSPIVSTTSNVAIPDDTIEKEHLGRNNVPEASSKAGSQKKKTKPLRLATTAPKRKLFCQSMDLMSAPLDALKMSGGRRSQGLLDPEASNNRREELSTEKRPAAVMLQDVSVLPPVEKSSTSAAVEQETIDTIISSQPDIEDAFQSSTKQSRISTPVQPDQPVLDPDMKVQAPATISDVDYGTSPFDTQSLTTIADATSKQPPKVQLHRDAPAGPQGDISTVTQITNGSGAGVPANSTIAAQGQVAIEKRTPTLRRHCSDTTSNTSPTKMTNAAEPLTIAPLRQPQQQAQQQPYKYQRPQRSVRSPLKRAETIGVGARPSDAQRQATRTSDKARRLLEEQALKDADLGPWSREAWDLFGWVPEGREHGRTDDGAKQGQEQAVGLGVG